MTAQAGGASFDGSDKRHSRKNVAGKTRVSCRHRATASTKICETVTRSREFRSSKMIACYLPLSVEVDTRFIIERAWRANKRVFVPITHRDGKMFFREIRPDTRLIRNSMSIWEPTSGEFVSPRLLQLVIAPTVAFDESNNRIGMGGGYYDRCFAFLRHRTEWIQPKLVGVAFNCQKVEKIWPNTWDVRLYRAITESNFS